MKDYVLRALVLCFIAIGVFSSCRYSENFYEGAEVTLSFSKDTLRFDTVFTTVGSATRSFKVYNPYNDPVLLSSVELEKGSESFFRLNVNGRPGVGVEDIEIPAKDSMYIFAEVTIDPDMDVTASPFIIEEKVRIRANGSEQVVHLEAWGQNANYVPSNNAKGTFSLLSCDLNTVIWNDPKPYVIYGILIVDSCTLELPPDCQVYVHGGIAFTEDRSTYNDGRIIVLKDGKLVSKGSLEQPVVIQGDRLEPELDLLPAQWFGIQIFPESKGNYFEHTIIKNGITGLYLDSLAEAELESVEISNHASRALLTFHVGKLQVNNSLFHSSQSESVLIKYGGDVNFNYSTIAGYEGSQVAALHADNFRCTDEVFCAPILVNPLRISLKNSVISGQSSDELTFVDGTLGEVSETLQYNLQNCAIRVDTLLNVFPNFYDNCEDCFTLNLAENLFLDLDEKDFRPDTLSQLIGKAKPTPGILMDIDGNTRDAMNPDVGCYEYQF